MIPVAATMAPRMPIVSGQMALQKSDPSLAMDCWTLAMLASVAPRDSRRQARALRSESRGTVAQPSTLTMVMMAAVAPTMAAPCSHSAR